MKRIIRHIPNTITCMNLLCGSLALTYVFKGQITIAFHLMIAAAVFDFLDGFAARLLKAYSAIGKELDSLADLISFGLVPASMLYISYVPCAPRPWMAFFPFIVAAFSALRLAKFNLDERQSENFIGLATPANALLIASAVIFSTHNENWGLLMSTAWMIPCLSLVLSLLLVSELPMFSLKVKHLNIADNRTRILFLLLSLVLTLTAWCAQWHWSQALLLILCLYILLSALVRLFAKERK